jgi:hypothetical protein
MNGQLYTLTALPLGKQPLVHMGMRGWGWAFRSCVDILKKIKNKKVKVKR